jgi:hypothetical protein
VRGGADARDAGRVRGHRLAVRAGEAPAAQPGGIAAKAPMQTGRALRSCIRSERFNEDRSQAYQRMVREVLEAQRAAVMGLRNDGVISNDVMHRIEREPDLEDQRLEI